MFVSRKTKSPVKIFINNRGERNKIFEEKHWNIVKQKDCKVTLPEVGRFGDILLWEEEILQSCQY